ncbi:hypothetical protein CBL_08226 [Carabus blaptoides fortunei]
MALHVTISLYIVHSEGYKCSNQVEYMFRLVVCGQHALPDIDNALPSTRTQHWYSLARPLLYTCVILQRQTTLALCDNVLTLTFLSMFYSDKWQDEGPFRMNREQTPYELNVVGGDQLYLEEESLRYSFNCPREIRGPKPSRVWLNDLITPEHDVHGVPVQPAVALLWSLSPSIQKQPYYYLQISSVPWRLVIQLKYSLFAAGNISRCATTIFQLFLFANQQCKPISGIWICSNMDSGMALTLSREYCIILDF